MGTLLQLISSVTINCKQNLKPHFPFFPAKAFFIFIAKHFVGLWVIKQSCFIYIVNIGWWIPFNQAEQFFFPIFTQFSFTLEFSLHTFFWAMLTFLQKVDPTIRCRKVFHFILFGKSKGFFFNQRSINNYFLSMNLSIKWDSRRDRGVTFIYFHIFTWCLTIAANFNMRVF